MGSERITSKVGNLGIFSSSPVEITEQQAKYTLQTGKIKERFDSLGVQYKGIQQTGGLVSSNPSPGADLYYYHPDHLGSSSLITDNNGTLVQHIQYVPFGEVFVEERASASSWQTPYLFNAKELDDETGLYYYGARYYDPRTSVWLSVDPLAEKYPNVGSYVYCVNNPVKFVDPDGKRLIYAQGSSSGFKNNVVTSIRYMNRMGTSGIIKQIMNHSKTITIKEYSGNSYFDPATNTIYWNPEMGVLTTNWVILSPSTVLNHEADHALQKLINSKQQAIDKITPDKDYENKEEKRVINTSEKETALKHGEIKEGEITRNNHSGKRYNTKSPTTTEGKNEVVVTPKRKEEK